LNRTLGPGEMLPPERGLREIFNISRATQQAAPEDIACLGDLLEKARAKACQGSIEAFAVVIDEFSLYRDFSREEGLK